MDGYHASGALATDRDGMLEAQGRAPKPVLF